MKNPFEQKSPQRKQTSSLVLLVLSRGIYIPSSMVDTNVRSDVGKKYTFFKAAISFNIQWLKDTLVTHKSQSSKTHENGQPSLLDA